MLVFLMLFPSLPLFLGSATKGIFKNNYNKKLKICMKHKRSRITKIILRKKNGAGEISL